MASRFNFRTYCKLDDTIRYCNSVKDFNLLHNIIIESNRHYILMQSTNCVDSHGNEIFEGDIVKETKDNEHYICEVKYDDYLKQFRLHRFKGRQSYLLIDYDSYDEIINDCNNHDRVIGEIIGNIYQNPERLEK